MKLYFSPGACSLAPHIALEELGMKYEGVKINLAHKPDDFLKLNPKGYVPTLVLDNGEVLTEAQVILQYLADQKPEKNMIPKAGTWDRYRAMEMLNFISTEIHKGFGPLWHLKDLAPAPEGQAHLKEEVLKSLSKRCDWLNTRLQSAPFLMGETFTVCDAYLFTILGWTKFLHVDMSKWPALLGFMERVQSRPAVQAAMKAEGLMK